MLQKSGQRMERGKHWRGILSFDFDLVSKEVDMESFSMFQRGINPVTGGKLTQRHVTNGPRFFLIFNVLHRSRYLS